MIKALTNLINEVQKPGMVVAEVGAWVGLTTRDYMPIIVNNNGKAIVVDWFSGNEDIQNSSNHIHRFQPENSDKIYAEFVSNLTGYMDHIDVYWGRSNEMASRIKDESLDLCFIDADHIYDGVKRDIQLYLPKVRPGGILCGHDCEDLSLAGSFSDEVVMMHYHEGVHPGVIQAVYDCFGTNVEVRPDLAGDGVPIWIYRK